MNVEMAQELLSYNTWANDRMLEAVSHLSAQQFSRELGGSYPSIQATLTHLLWAEWLWLERWQDSFADGAVRAGGVPVGRKRQGPLAKRSGGSARVRDIPY